MSHIHNCFCEQIESSPKIRVFSSGICYIFAYTFNMYLTMSFPYACIIRDGRLKMAKYLIEEQGCSVGCTDNEGHTPLLLACR